MVLCVSQKHPYKNLHRLDAGAAGPRRRRRRWCSRASPPRTSASCARSRSELGVDERVRLPDWLSDGSLAGLYALSSAFVLPSLVEGFGLPVLEAMLRGVPVACSNTLLAAGGGRRCGTAVRPERPGAGHRRDPAAAGGPRARRAPGRARARARGEVHLGAHGRARASRATGGRSPQRARWPAAEARLRLRASLADRAPRPDRPRPSGHALGAGAMAGAAARFEVSYLLTRSNRFPPPGGAAGARRARCATCCPRGRSGRSGARVLGDRYLACGRAASRARTSCTPRSSPTGSPRRPPGASAAMASGSCRPSGRRCRCMGAYRNRHARRYRQLVLAETDLFLPATERAAKALRLEGVEEARITVCAAGDRRRALRACGRASSRAGGAPIVSPGRLVWEKGHQDVLRALAALHRGIVTPPTGGGALPRLLIVGAGPRSAAPARARGRAGAGEARGDRVPFPTSGCRRCSRARPRWCSPACRRRAPPTTPSTFPTPSGRSSSGMVLAEAMAAGLRDRHDDQRRDPRGAGRARVDLVAPGDWMGIARALAAGPLSRPPARGSTIRPRCLGATRRPPPRTAGRGLRSSALGCAPVGAARKTICSV